MNSLCRQDDFELPILSPPPECWSFKYLLLWGLCGARDRAPFSRQANTLPSELLCQRVYVDFVINRGFRKGSQGALCIAKSVQRSFASLACRTLHWGTAAESRELFRTISTNWRSQGGSVGAEPQGREKVGGGTGKPLPWGLDRGGLPTRFCRAEICRLQLETHMRNCSEATGLIRRSQTSLG